MAILRSVTVFTRVHRLPKRQVLKASASYATVAPSPRAAREEGTIATVFTSLTPGETTPALPDRFALLKQMLWKDEFVHSWKEVLNELEAKTEEVASEGSDIIPRVPFKDLEGGLSDEQVQAIKSVGAVVVTGGVPKEEALGWKQSIRDYVAANPGKVKGFPPERIQAYELYNTVAQTRARTHPALLVTQSKLLSLWHASPSTPVSLKTAISYFDRLRIRDPGDSTFALGPHIDGGSLERWEDPGYRACFGKVFDGKWKEHDPFDASPRLKATQDLYNAPNQCTVFRCWQGWTALSSTGPGEGTLRVLPMLKLATAYTMFRPFFRPRDPSSSSLKFEDWEPNLDGTEFPGSAMKKGQELNEKTHPHLRLEKTMVSVPRVEPGDQVYWHCDTVHAVEAEHKGKGDASVLYIPAVPLTVNNAHYLRDQRTNFLAGLPAPDFPGGEGESHFTGRGTMRDATCEDGLRALGLAPFEAVAGTNAAVIDETNAILGHK